MTANERSFKRDAWISQRHRTWGMDVPMQDLDFVCAEYDNALPVALVDYKHEHAPIDLNSIGAKVLTNLGDMAGIPAFFVRYGHTNQDGYWGDIAEDSTPWFQLMPLNIYAHGLDLPTLDDNTELTELEYVSWLYSIRGRAIPPHIVKHIAGHDN